MGFFGSLFKPDPELDFQLALQAETLEGNLEKAAWLYEKAVKQNHAGAQLNLAYAYLKGRGVSLNPERAFELAKQSASQGYYKAQYLLAHMYQKGVGVSQDIEQSNLWMARFNSQGRDASKLTFLDLS